MRIFKYLLIGIIIFCFFNIINVKASDIVISGNSVYRKSSTEVSISFISNTTGTLYYIVDTNQSTTIENLLLGNTDENIESNVTKIIDIPSALLSSGAKYVHLVVKDALGNYSNILTISIPKNVYYFDDFEAYNINSYPNYFVIKHNGGDASKQKITELNENKIFNVYGTFGTGLDERIQINPISTGYVVLEADIYASIMPDGWHFAGLFVGSDRNINVLVNKNSKKFVGANIFTGTGYNNKHASNIIFNLNTNYNVKIVVDVENKKFDYYINGAKVNLVPVDAWQSFEELTEFGIYNGGGTIYYDNIKFYSQPTNPFNSITKGSEINGTFTINKTSAEKDEIITITALANTGYRVKSVKVNNSEFGITNKNTYYTFTMPEEDAEVTVEFEKIPYTITINSVTGALINPNETINVKYGDSQDITIAPTTGYKLKSLKVNGVEKSPLINNKITLTNITEDKIVEVVVEKIIYKVTNGSNQTHIIGTQEDAVFRIDADKSLFKKVYLNDEELDQKNYTVTEGSTIITLKKDYLNNLLSGTYILKATFNDGGEAKTTFVILKPEENNPKTYDSIMISIILGIISLIGLFGGYKLYKKFKIVRNY